ncbi:MAG TPA: DUF2306 domain-containing protein, partial [Allosphingosinicella sp.]|nr:DUF2306 domain-containing protein [Allosphingosinicella sp.]
MATRAVRPVGPFGWRNILVVGAATTLLTFTLMALSFGITPQPGRPTAISPALLIHIGTVLPALPLGAYVLLRPKGGPLHRILGRIWAGLMVTTAISSFWLHDGGGLSFIHIFSVATLISIPLAIFWIRRGDVERHRRTMTNVYIGLVVAGFFSFA